MSELPGTPADPSLPEPEPPRGRFAAAHRLLLIFGGLALVAWLLSGIYQVNADEVAIVERLGAYLSTPEGKARIVEPGLQYHLPWPIDTVHKVSIQQTRNLVVNTFNMPPDSQADIKFEARKRGEPANLVSAKYDPYLITADKNVIHIEIAVTYRIDDPEAWLNTVSHMQDAPVEYDGRNNLLQQIAQSALTVHVASLPVDAILFEQRAQLKAILTRALQEGMEVRDASDPERRIDIGAQVIGVDVVDVKPPDWVKPAFDAVSQARSERETTINMAKSEQTARQARADGEASAMRAEANAYAQRVVYAAGGEVSRFNQIYEQYRKAPDLTRWNVFVDGLRTVADNARRILFVKRGETIYIPIDPVQFNPNQTATTNPG